MTEYDKQEDYEIITKLTGSIMFSLKIRPNINIGIAIGVPHSLPPEEAIYCFIEQHWMHYTDHLPTDSSSIFLLAGKMGLEINYALTDFYEGYSWQHVPEYPDL